MVPRPFGVAQRGRRRLLRPGELNPIEIVRWRIWAMRPVVTIPAERLPQSLCGRVHIMPVLASLDAVQGARAALSVRAFLSVRELGSIRKSAEGTPCVVPQRRESGWRDELAHVATTDECMECRVVRG